MAEFHVFERNLYQMPQRQPLTNGILDQRLARQESAAAQPRSRQRRGRRTRRGSA